MEERRRSSRLRSREYDRVLLRQEAELADREQLRAERQERWELEKREREVKLRHSSWRERIEICMSIACLLGALALLVAGIRSGEPYTLGGSGVVTVASVLWLLRGLIAGAQEPTAQSSRRLSAEG